MKNTIEAKDISGLSAGLKKIFNIISDAGEQCGQPVYVIGGFVRDYYLGRLKDNLPPDIDFVTVGSGILLAQKVAALLETKKISVFKKFGTAQVSYGDIDLEFVGARRESYNRESRKPVVEDGSLEDDQLRRDLTINAMSWSLQKKNFGELIDPFEGMQDLKNGIVRTPRDPEITFSDDPLRMMRAIRFATQLDFEIEKSTLEGIKAQASRLEIISAERISVELNKILLSPKPSKGFYVLSETGLLKHFLPEMEKLHGVEIVNGIGHKDNFKHTLQVLDNTAENSENLWLRWAALLHDIAKPPTKKFSETAGWTFHGHEVLGAKWVRRIFRRLALPLDDRMRYVQKLVRLHLRPIALVDEIVTDSAIRRLIFDAGDDIDDLMQLCRADITSKNDRKVKRFLRNFDSVEQKIKEVEEKDRVRNWKPPIDGLEIMQLLNLKPGKEVGIVKKAIEEAILDGIIPNSHEAAKNYMLENKDQLLRGTNK